MLLAFGHISFSYLLMGIWMIVHAKWQGGSPLCYINAGILFLGSLYGYIWPLLWKA